MIKTVKIWSIRTSNRCPETFKMFEEGLGLYKVDPGLCEEGEDDGVGATTNEKRFSQMCQEIRKFWPNKLLQSIFLSVH